ncbi:MAG: hypothetical protein ACFB02_02730 [Mastigocoleus sp.]
MSANPVWYLFQLRTPVALYVKKLFDQAVNESQLVQTTSEILKNRITKEDNLNNLDKHTFNRFIPRAFIDKQQKPEVFDWDDLHNTYHLFFPQAFVKMFEYLFVTNSSAIPKAIIELDFIITNRVGAAEILWGGLGWERGMRLPGFFGNIFILSEEVATVLENVEKIFEEVDHTEFIKGAQAIALRGNGNEDVAKDIKSLFLSALRTALKERNGFLALNYPAMGSIPFLNPN